MGTYGDITGMWVYNEGETCLVLLEKLCLLAQDSLKHLGLQAAVHAAHGAVEDPVTHELQHRTTERQRVCSGAGEKVPAGVHFGQQPQFPAPSFSGPPDLAMVRMDMRVRFRVKAVAVPSCRIQSVRRPVKNGIAISPGEGEESGVSHKNQLYGRGCRQAALFHPHQHPGGQRRNSTALR